MHAEWLTSVAKGEILEIGVRTGISTAALLLGVEAQGGHVYSVDINPACKNPITSNPHWTFIVADSKNVALVTGQVPSALDILFVDGDHTYEGTLADLNNYGGFVKPGGKIICHDVLSGYDPGVRKAFDEYVEKTGYVAEIFASWIGLGWIQVP